MIIRVAVLVFALLMSHDLKGTIGHHLIYIHVCRRTGTTLHKINRELVDQCTLHNLFTSLFDGRTNLLVKRSKRNIGMGSRPLHHCKRFDIIRVVTDGDTGDILKVHHSSQCLHTIIGIGGNLNLAQRIVFKTCLHLISILSSLYQTSVKRYCLSTTGQQQPICEDRK